LSGILSEPAAAGDGAAAAGEGDDPRDVGCDLVPTRRELRRVAGAFESDIVQIQKEFFFFFIPHRGSRFDSKLRRQF
jgi:hypothetical protein